MQLLISDANILIDMEEGGLVERIFRIPFQFKIPDILFEEELEAKHEHLLELGLMLGELTGESVQYGSEIMMCYRQTSRNDCFALALARQEKCPILTGDKALRSAAEKEGVVVMGTIWLVEQLIEQSLITTEVAREAFQRMKVAGRRLPWGMADAMLNEH